MKKSRDKASLLKNWYFQTFFSYVLGIGLTIGLPGVFYLIFRIPTGNLLAVHSIFSFTILSLFLWKAFSVRYQKKDKIPGFILVVLLAVLAVIVLIDIILIPYSEYVFWFKEFSTKSQIFEDEAVFTVFVMIFSFFSSLFCGLLLEKRDLRYASGFLLFVALLLLIVIKSIIMLMIVLFLVLFNIVLLSRINYRADGRLKQRLVTRFLLFSQIIVGFLVLLALSLIFALIAKPQGDATVNRTLSPFFRDLVMTYLPDFPLLYGIAGYGDSFQYTDLKGSPVLTKIPVFDVQAPPGSTIYLRKQVLDSFNGIGWGQSVDLLNEAKKASLPFPLTFDSTVRFDNQEDSPDNSRLYLQNAVVTIRLLQKTAFLPHFLNTRSVRIHTERKINPEYTDLNAGIRFDFPLLRDDVIELKTTGSIDYFYALLKPESADDLLKTSGENTAVLENAARYLNVPGSLNSRIRNLAGQFQNYVSGDQTLSFVNYKNLLQNLKAYLQNDFIYSLDKKIPDNPNFLYDFLFTDKKGFCVHFATAFTILARLNHIPARYVTGFYSYVPQDKTHVIITGLSFHAWVEVWFPDTGWIVIEATPPMDPTYFEDPLDAPNINVAGDALTALQLNSLGGKEELHEREKGTADYAFVYAILALVFFGLLLFIFVPFKKLYPLIRQGNDGYHYNLSGIERKIQGTARRLVRLSGVRLVGSPRQIGWVKWQREVDNTLPELKRYTDRTVNLILRSFYSRLDCTARELKFLKLYSRYLNSVIHS